MAKDNGNGNGNGEVQVVRADNPRHVLFSGLEKDARKFVQDNFPRRHVDAAVAGAVVNPPADVHLVHANGDREHFLGVEEETPWQKVED